MLILFPSSSLNPREVDQHFWPEFIAATNAGFSTGLLDSEALDRQQFSRSIRFVKDVGPAIYRGWMLRSEHYAELYNTLNIQGVQIRTTPDQYKHAHHLPENYELIKDHTAKSIWTDISSATTDVWLDEVGKVFGDSALIIKDYVKSEKHYWHQACFIPTANDRNTVKETIKNFISLRGNALTGGIVFRQYVPLKPSGRQPNGRMPRSLEYRFFYLNGSIIAHSYYDVEPGIKSAAKIKQGMPPELEVAVKKIRSSFFTVDIAKKIDESWMVIELGDGQVAGIPTAIKPSEFYSELFKNI